MGGVGSGRKLQNASRQRVECMNLWCGWKTDRLATANIKPCPKCGGPVLPRMRKPSDPKRVPDQMQGNFAASKQDMAELRELGGGSVSEAATQIIRGVLAQRRLLRVVRQLSEDSGNS